MDELRLFNDCAMYVDADLADREKIRGIPILKPKRTIKKKNPMIHPKAVHVRRFATAGSISSESLKSMASCLFFFVLPPVVSYKLIENSARENKKAQPPMSTGKRAVLNGHLRAETITPIEITAKQRVMTC